MVNKKKAKRTRKSNLTMPRRKKPTRCIAKKVDGKRCTRNAVSGKRCKQHPAKKGGRPQVQWDENEWKQFDIFCAARDSQADIAEAMEVDIKTIDAICKREKGMSFSAYSDQKRGYGRALIAGKQLEVAIGGNVAMLIWLGKQWLDQKEPRQILGHEGSKGGPIAMTTEIVFVKPDGTYGDGKGRS